MPQEIQKCDFEMVVNDVFSFEDGRTVFAGEVSRGPSYIKTCDCELLIVGVLVARFRIEDEMMPLHKAQKNLRAVSTVARVDVALVQRSKGQCRLRSVRL